MRQLCNSPRCCCASHCCGCFSFVDSSCPWVFVMMVRSRYDDDQPSSLYISRVVCTRASSSLLLSSPTCLALGDGRRMSMALKHSWRSFGSIDDVSGCRFTLFFLPLYLASGAQQQFVCDSFPSTVVSLDAFYVEARRTHFFHHHITTMTDFIFNCWNFPTSLWSFDVC